MSAVMEVLDESAPFFAPSSTDVISTLLSQYRQSRNQINEVAEMVANDAGNVMRYFLEGNKDRCSFMPSVERLFDPAGAIFKLSAEYWSKTLALTDVYEAMPQARRDYWNAQIRGDKSVTIGHRSEEVPPLPEFTEDAVRPTIASLLADRGKFFAERVDGIFRGLSGDHVTNCPQGFSKRMIIACVTDNGYHSTSRAGLINDLRAVIAKFMGRDEPKWNATNSVVSIARQRHGEWLTLDGGALRIKCFMVGTAHLEVHPDMAYRLNQVLAGMHPRAIPAEFRTKPAKKSKVFRMIGRPLPFAVIEILRELRRDRGTNTFRFGYGYEESAVAREEAIRVLIGIGGVLSRTGEMAFDFDPREALDEIIASGCIPDRVAHQYFPTPEVIARAAINLAEIGPDDTVLEPSAGQGGIADHFPQQRHAVCVEISKLHCEILRAKGFVTVQADFLEWAPSAPKFDRIVMNPPFSEGRALMHLKAAAALLKPAGRVVAVLPASFKGKDVLPGLNVAWSDVYEGEFAGTSVSTVILKAEAP